MLTKEEKAKIVKDYQRFEGDTGSVEVQVALLTATINKLTLKGTLVDQDGNVIKIIDKDGNTLREGTSTIATLTVNELIM